MQTTKTSVHGAINMLGLAKRVRAKILQASTSEVYGDPNVHPQTEDYWGNVNPIGPRSCYDEGKRCAETLFFDYRRQHQLRDQGRAHLQHLRPAHASQRRPRGVEFHRPGAARPRHHGLRRRPQTRSFCYVDDLIDGLIRADGIADDSVTGPINIGNPVEFTILRTRRTGDRADRLALASIVHRPMPQDDPRQRRPDISKANDVLDWAPRTPLREGLEKTIAYFEELLRDQSLHARLTTAVA